MDSQAQLQRNYGHHQAEEPIRIHHPEEEEHHEKGPSKVLKKVKEKAKQIKKALTKHGHDRSEQQHIPDDHDLDQEDTEDYDHHQDQHIHGGAPRKTHIQVKKEEEEIIPPGTKAFPVVSSSDGHKAPSRPVRTSNEKRGDAATLTPHNTPVSLLSSKEDPAASGTNYQSNVTDPTRKALGRQKGTSEADQLGLGRDLPKKSPGYDIKPESEPERNIPVRRYEFDVKSGNDLPTRTQSEEKHQSSYSDKIASATSVLTDKAVAAKNAKLGYCGDGEGEETQTSGGGYGSIVSEKLTPLYDKVKETGSTVITKLPLSGYGTGTETETEQGQDKGVSAKEYLSEKLSPGEEDKALSEVVTEKLHLGGENTTAAPAKKGVVTQSEEVEKRLGGFTDQRSQEERKHGEAFAEEGEGGMVEKIRGAVTSWISGTTEEVVQKSTDSSAQSLGSTVGNIAAGKTDGGDNKGAVNLQNRFQESGK